MKHYNHIIRFVTILILVGIGFLLVRSFIVPDSFGVYGSYTYGYHRGDSDREQEAYPPFYKGEKRCGICHEAQVSDIMSGAHKTITCEACHGVFKAHNAETASLVKKDSSNEACLVCHQQLAARPVTFPQIVSLRLHMGEQDEVFEEQMTCGSCHIAHTPL